MVMDAGKMIEFDSPEKLLKVSIFIFSRYKTYFIFQNEKSVFRSMATESKDAKHLFETVGLEYKKNV